MYVTKQELEKIYLQHITSLHLEESLTPEKKLLISEEIAVNDSDQPTTQSKIYIVRRQPHTIGPSTIKNLNGAVNAIPSIEEVPTNGQRFLMGNTAETISFHQFWPSRTIPSQYCCRHFSSLIQNNPDIDIKSLNSKVNIRNAFLKDPQSGLLFHSEEFEDPNFERRPNQIFFCKEKFGEILTQIAQKLKSGESFRISLSTQYHSLTVIMQAIQINNGNTYFEAKLYDPNLTNNWTTIYAAEPNHFRQTNTCILGKWLDHNILQKYPPYSLLSLIISNQYARNIFSESNIDVLYPVQDDFDSLIKMFNAAHEIPNHTPVDGFDNVFQLFINDAPALLIKLFNKYSSDENKILRLFSALLDSPVHKQRLEQIPDGLYWAKHAESERLKIQATWLTASLKALKLPGSIYNGLIEKINTWNGLNSSKAYSKLRVISWALYRAGASNTPLNTFYDTLLNQSTQKILTKKRGLTKSELSGIIDQIKAAKSAIDSKVPTSQSSQNIFSNSAQPELNQQPSIGSPPQTTANSHP